MNDEPTPSERDEIALLLRLAGPRDPVPALCAERVRTAVRDVWRGEVRRRSRRRGAYWTGGLALAAAAILAVGLALRGDLRVPVEAKVVVASVERTTGAFTGRRGGDPPQALAAGSELWSGSVVATGEDARAALRLTDGEVMRLDFGTRLRLLAPASFELLEGSLYVATDESSEGKTLEIRTRFGSARDVGTQFLVQVGEDALLVRVRDGAVELEQDDGETHRAEAGTELEVDAAGAVTAREVALHGEPWEWVLALAEPFEVNGATLAAFLGWVERETGWRVRYASADLGRTAEDVVLSAPGTDLGPDRAPEVVLPTCGLSHRLEGGTLVIERFSEGGTTP